MQNRKSQIRGRAIRGQQTVCGFRSHVSFKTLMVLKKVGETSSGFWKFSLKRSRSFRVISSNQKQARTLTSTSKTIVRCLATFRKNVNTAGSDNFRNQLVLIPSTENTHFYKWWHSKKNLSFSSIFYCRIKSLHSQLAEKTIRLRLLQNNNDGEDEPNEPEWSLDPAFCRTDFAHMKDLARDSCK